MNVDKYMKTRSHESPGQADHSLPDIFSRPCSVRIAVYSDNDLGPQVYEISSHNPGGLMEQLAEKVFRLAKTGGGGIPLAAIGEIADNLIHAGFAGTTISVLNGGNEIRFADRGPGIDDTKKALRRGYSTADENLRTFIRGVGSGLPVANKIMANLGGSLEIENNLNGGAVLVLRLPRTQGAKKRAETPPGKNSEIFSLTKRQKKVFFIIIELGAVGPSRIAKELSVGLSTVYRDIGALERAGLIKSATRGKRTMTDTGLKCVDLIINS
jgi:hypothetical protein